MTQRRQRVLHAGRGTRFAPDLQRDHHRRFDAGLQNPSGDRTPEPRGSLGNPQDEPAIRNGGELGRVGVGVGRAAGQARRQIPLEIGAARARRCKFAERRRQQAGGWLRRLRRRLR